MEWGLEFGIANYRVMLAHIFPRDTNNIENIENIENNIEKIRNTYQTNNSLYYLYIDLNREHVWLLLIIYYYHLI